MKLYFSDQPLPTKVTHSVFLAGPSPRPGEHFEHWRHEAVRILEEEGFEGDVLIPIPESFFKNEDKGGEDYDYANQIQWEIDARNMADLIAFWVNRDTSNGINGFTTNIEFGEDLDTGKVLYGRPEGADKITYMDTRIDMLGEPVFTRLDELMLAVVDMLGEGSLRTGGEVFIPLYIWETVQFQNWYTQLIENGNHIDEAKVLHSFRLPNGVVFSFTLWVKVWINDEDRFKENEFVFARSDISVILPYRVDASGDTDIILIKEFRSPVRNDEGIVYELPGGSSMKGGVDPLVNAQHELFEETGIQIDDVTRFEFVENRQLLATLSSHHAYLFRVELTREEMNQAYAAMTNQKTFGVTEDTERTYLTVAQLSNITDYPLDYSMLGMILSGLNQ